MRAIVVCKARSAWSVVWEISVQLAASDLGMKPQPFIAYLRRYRGEMRYRSTQRARNIQRIEFLEQFIARQGTGAELGVHKGHFSQVLLDRLAPQKLYLIDPWYLQGKQWSWGDGNRRVMDALCYVLRKMEDELVSGQVVLLIENDLEALAKMPDGHLDWVYLDTTHQYEQTVKELEVLKVKVKPGGVISGDDWQPDPSHKYYGVCRAVREFVDREKHAVLCVDAKTHQWIIAWK